MNQIAWSEWDMKNQPFDLRVYNEEDKIILMIEQAEGMLYLSFPNEVRYQQFLQGLGR